ncbi:MAG: hypothetical protein DA328_04175 [Nitrososphaeraceae archaeon]|nr:hypothetical protein [Nitrososphaeraceae archaeon]
MLGLEDYVNRILGFFVKPKNKNSDQVYERMTCKVCDQICYNKKDLRIHIKAEHPNIENSLSK